MKSFRMQDTGLMHFMILTSCSQKRSRSAKDDSYTSARTHGDDRQPALRFATTSMHVPSSKIAILRLKAVLASTYREEATGSALTSVIYKISGNNSVRRCEFLRKNRCFR